jgi:small subunit ribosomal protein S7
MRGNVQSRQQELRPDYKYENKKVAKFINYIMIGGEKERTRTLVYDAFDIIEDEMDVDDPTDVFIDALENVGPQMEVRSRRIGGANYQVPYEVRPDRQVQLAMRWIINIARGQEGTPMAEALAAELMEAAKGEGKAVAKKEQSHKMAEANKAFAHFAQ